MTAEQEKACRVCKGSPAAEVRFIRHTGMLLAWQQASYRGSWCRDCGLATFRRLQNWNLMIGWWGIASVFLNAYAILRNLSSRGKVLSLSEPSRPAGSKPLEVGRPLLARPGIWIFIVALIIIVSLIATHAGH